ncbi:MAG: type IX secretion system membrane protein PorP/SprF [Cytophagales bacterium]|nr:MAG: type IX secretion system membrane protein PorP/SprF [Cytophagales bacterium]
MKKNILVGLALFFTFYSLQAQQRPQYSQYMLNNFILNPAVAGTSEHYDIKAGYRNQWTGINDNADPTNIRGIAPRTLYVTGHMHLGQHIGPYRGKHRNEPKNFHGLGGMIVADKTDITSFTSFYLAYSFNMKLADNLRVALGTFLGGQQFRLDGSLVRVRDPLNPLSSGITKTVPDGSLGAWIYSSDFYVGASAHQLFQNKLFANDLNLANQGLNKLSSHLFLTGGYLFKVNKDFKIIPSFLVKYVSPAPMSFDINLKTRYKDMMWAGASYRQDGSLVFLLGGVIKNLIEFGYAFDYSTAAISRTNAGSHEIIVGVRLNPQGRVTSPSDFW